MEATNRIIIPGSFIFPSIESVLPDPVDPNAKQEMLRPFINALM